MKSPTPQKSKSDVLRQMFPHLQQIGTKSFSYQFIPFCSICNKDIALGTSHCDKELHNAVDLV